MSAKYMLTVRKGSLMGKIYTCTGAESLIIGRQKDCSIVLPDATVSRHHCRIDIRPSLIQIRDLGSLHGTYLNGKKIGQRSGGMHGELSSVPFGQAFSVKPGDRLGLGEYCELELQMKLSRYCAVCLKEMDDNDKVDPEGLPICRACYDLRTENYGATGVGAEAGLEAKRLVSQQNRCEVCEKVLDQDEAGLCARCQDDPRRMFMFLLEQMGRCVNNAREIAGYRMIAMLGQSIRSHVWLVEEAESGRRMAFKRMILKAGEYDSIRRSFLREAFVAGQLDHENVVRYYELGLCGESYFILMELCEGGSVAELLQERGGTLDLDLATTIILQVLDGLYYAHTASVLKLVNEKIMPACGIVHGNLKPENILLGGRNREPTAKVADFGLAKAFEVSGRAHCNVVSDTPPAVDVRAAAATYAHMLGCFTQGSSAIPKKLAEVIDYALLEEPIRVTSAMELKRMIMGAL